MFLLPEIRNLNGLHKTVVLGSTRMFLRLRVLLEGDLGNTERGMWKIRTVGGVC